MSNHYGSKPIVTDGLILYWDVASPKSYTDGSSVIYDLSGNGNHGAVANSYVTYSSDYKGVITFQATSSSRVSIANTSFDKRTSNYTVIAGSRYYGYNRQRMVTSFNNWLLGHWASGADVHYAEGWVTSTTRTNDTQWRIYAGTGDISGDTYKFYINGSLHTSSSGGSAGPYGIQIGGLNSENSDGQFSFIQVYNRVLPADEIAQNYNALRYRFGL